MKPKRRGQRGRSAAEDALVPALVPEEVASEEAVQAPGVLEVAAPVPLADSEGEEASGAGVASGAEDGVGSAEALSELLADLPTEVDLPSEESALERIEDRQLLAVLFGSPEELTIPRLAEILGWKRKAVEQRLPRVKAWLDRLVLPFELRLIAGGWRLVSRSEYAELLGRLRVVRRRDRLSQAALEVLSVVAYKQPVTSGEVDRIRGVNCSSILRLLLDRELVHVVGRQESPGRPLLYATTKLFLDRFGLGALQELPGIEAAAQEGFAAEGEEESVEDGSLATAPEPEASDRGADAAASTARDASETDE